MPDPTSVLIFVSKSLATLGKYINDVYRPNLYQEYIPTINSYAI
jgi:hypothetical protein